ncbi:hypothetical protein LCGC14_2322950, partial [marine sediment metagenome]
MKIVLINDTSDNGHFGCQLVGKAYRDLLDERGVEIIKTQYRREPLDRKACDRADLVIVNGEGCIHHGKYEELLQIGNEYPAILMNCSIQNLANNPYDSLRAFKRVTVRESYTYDYLRRIVGFGAHIVPDVIFARKLRRTRPVISKELFTSDCSRRSHQDWSCRAKSPDFLATLSSYSHASVGRFHAACACAMMGIPFTAWRGNTWKVEGLLQD